MKFIFLFRYSKEEDQLLLHIKEKNFIKYKSIVSSLMLNRTSNSVITRTYKLSTPKEILYGEYKLHSLSKCSPYFSNLQKLHQTQNPILEVNEIESVRHLCGKN